MKSGGDTISSGADDFCRWKRVGYMSSLLTLGSMGGIDLYLVVEMGDEEEEVEEEKITDEKSTRSVWGAEDRKRKRSPSI